MFDFAWSPSPKRPCADRLPRRRRVGLTGLLSLATAVLLAGAGSHAARAQPNEAIASPPGTIRVVGEATVTAKPDMAELDLGVISEAKTAEAAGADNAKKMDRVIALLKKEVGAAGEVKTVGYMVTERYSEAKPNDPKPVIVAYVVTNVVRARIPEVKSAGRIVDLALKQGANEVQRLIFTLKNPEPVQAEALKAAATKARARATALAAALGLKLGNVISVSDGDFGQHPAPFADMKRMSVADVATPIEAGQLEVSATVTIFFATSVH
jgi:uncharacterized protein YggE